MLRYLTSLTLVLALVACSSDEGTKDPDGGTPDTALTDQGPKGETFYPDSADDQSASDTKPSPDQTSTNPSDWAEVAQAPDVLNGVWGLDAKQVFAVGKGGVIMSWDGSKWGAMTNPETFDLTAIWGNATQVVAVGNGGDMIWDGTSWTKGYSGSSSYAFEDVSGGATYLFAAAGTSLYYRSMSSTSTYWSSIYVSSLTKAVHGVWAAGDNEVYAVGDDGVIIQCTASCPSYSSSNWSAMTTPKGVTSHLHALHRFSNKEMFAVGLDGTVLHYDGSKWTEMQLNTSTYFYGVWGSDPKDVWVVGHSLFKPDEAVWHYDGTSWTKSQLPRDNIKLNAVWGTGANDVWAVGPSTILHYKGQP
jgi:hypothetical protein